MLGLVSAEYVYTSPPVFYLTADLGPSLPQFGEKIDVRTYGLPKHIAGVHVTAYRLPLGK